MSYSNPYPSGSTASGAYPVYAQHSSANPYTLRSDAASPPPAAPPVSSAAAYQPTASAFAASSPAMEPSSSAAAYGQVLPPTSQLSPRSSVGYIPSASHPSSASPPPQAFHQQHAQHAAYHRPLMAASPPPASGHAGNGQPTFAVPSPSSSPSPAAPTNATHAPSTNAGSGKDSRSAKHNGTASISRSTRTGASKLIGEPDSVIRPPSRVSGVYIIVTAIEAIIVITLVGLIFGRIVTEVDSFSQDLKTVSVYLAMFVFGCAFQALVAWDAVRLKNTLQLIGVLIFNIALTITAAIEIQQVEDALAAQDRIEGGFPCPNDPSRFCRTRAALFPSVERYLIVVTAVCGVTEFILIYLTVKLWKEFGWVIYQKIGADLRIRNMFLLYQLFIVFLKFCFFFGVGFTVIYLILVANTSDWEYAVTVAAVPCAVIALLAAGFAVRKEWTSLMALSLLLMTAGLVYFVYKVTQVWLPATRDQYNYVRKTITFVSAFAILSLGLTLINGIICLLNFNKGLKPAHDAIGVFGGVSRHRPRDKSEGNALEAEPKENGEAQGVAGAEPNGYATNGFAANGHYGADHRQSLTPAGPLTAVSPQSRPNGVVSPPPMAAMGSTGLPPQSYDPGYPQGHEPRPSNTRISLD